MGSGKYLLKIDTKSGERQLFYKYKSMEKDMYMILCRLRMMFFLNIKDQSAI